MSRQAEAERERRARIIAADGEYQASKKLAQAATVMAADPAALQLRLLQTVVEVAAEKNSTLVMPFPVELLRFFDRAAVGPQPRRGASTDVTRPATPPASRPRPRLRCPLPSPGTQPPRAAEAAAMNGSPKAAPPADRPRHAGLVLRAEVGPRLGARRQAVDQRAVGPVAEPEADRPEIVQDLGVGDQTIAQPTCMRRASSRAASSHAGWALLASSSW